MFLCRMNFMQNPPPTYQAALPLASVLAPPVKAAEIPPLPQQISAPPSNVVPVDVVVPSVHPSMPAVFDPKQHAQSIDNANKAALQAAMYKAMMEQQKGTTPQGPTMADLSNFMLTQGSSV